MVVADVTYVEPVAVVVPAAPAPPVVQAPPPAPVAAAPQFWYYCENPPGYYPYVATCNGQYREVPIPADGGAAQQPPPQ